MKWYFYKFADGYFCWYAGRLSGIEKRNEIQTHGAIVETKIGTI